MISLNYEIKFKLQKSSDLKNWIKATIQSETKILGNISYIFCDNNYILEINKKYLNHDYFTDIITFDYSENNVISGDIFISIETVKQNANHYKTTFEEELHRVIIHGILHLCGYKDKTPTDKKIMRKKENFYLNEFKKH